MVTLFDVASNAILISSFSEKNLDWKRWYAVFTGMHDAAKDQGEL